MSPLELAERRRHILPVSLRRIARYLSPSDRRRVLAAVEFHNECRSRIEVLAGPRTPSDDFEGCTQ